MAGAQGSETVQELAIRTIVENYKKYASEEIPLLRKEGIDAPNFKKMIQTELSHMLKNTENEEAVDKLRHKLDKDGAKNSENEEAAEKRNAEGDRVIDFEKYWDFIGTIAGPIAQYKLETKTAVEPKGKNPVQ